jgi:hypothetical protein
MMTFMSRAARIAGGGPSPSVLSPVRWRDLSLSAQSQGLYCSVARLRVESLEHPRWLV